MTRMAQMSESSPSGLRDGLLNSLANRIPYARFLDIDFERHGDELTARLNFHQKLIGNPNPPALHGGATAAFLEITAVIELAWRMRLVRGQAKDSEGLVRLPKTIAYSVDYLRPGQPESAFARAVITRSGRRFATLHVVGWQSERNRLFAQATGHFLLPGAHESD